MFLGPVNNCSLLNIPDLLKGFEITTTKTKQRSQPNGVATFDVKSTENTLKMDRKSKIFSHFSVNFLSNFQFLFVYFDFISGRLVVDKSK